MNKTLSNFSIGEIYATGPGLGLIGTKVGEDKVFDLVQKRTIFVPANRIGETVSDKVLAELKKRLDWQKVVEASAVG